MSIVRVGLAETQKYSDGWAAIFGKKAGETKKPPPKAAKAKAKPRKGKK